VRIPVGRCWLQGDNIYNSTDSRFYGPVPLALIQGVVFFRVWPLRTMGYIPRKSVEDVATLHASKTSSAAPAAPQQRRPPQEALDAPPPKPRSPQESLGALIARGGSDGTLHEQAGEGRGRAGLVAELALTVERARTQAWIDGRDPAQATAKMQGALAKLFDESP